jgi:hypothetical protein
MTMRREARLVNFDAQIPQDTKQRGTFGVKKDARQMPVCELAKIHQYRRNKILPSSTVASSEGLRAVSSGQE